jgi:hypothetical protein
MRSVTAGLRLRHVVCSVLAVVAASSLASCAAAEHPPARTAPSSSSPPQQCSEGALEPFGCDTFRSHEGTDGSAPAPWLSTDPITVSFTVQNDTSTMIVSTPCNTINVPVTITSTQITPDIRGLTTGAMRCAPPASDYESWTRTFVSSPMTYSLSGKELRLESSNGRVQLDAGP